MPSHETSTNILVQLNYNELDLSIVIQKTKNGNKFNLLNNKKIFIKIR